MTARKLLAAGLVAALLPVSGCAVLPGGGDKTRLTVYFARATSFYEGSKVKVMGVDVGKVDKVEILGDRIRVEATVDGDVPLPTDLSASIMPLNLVGERNLVLFPPWEPGKPKAGRTITVEQDRTSLPVETDQALEAFAKVLDAVDPLQAKRVTKKFADSFGGNGQAFNEALRQTGQLTETLGGQADTLAELAENLNVLAGVVRGKEDTLGEMIDQLSAATKVFSDERASIKRLVEGLAKLVKAGDVIIEKYEGTLPDDLRVLTQVSLVVKGQTDRLAQLIQALPGLAGAFVKTWNKKTHLVELRFAVDPSLRNVLAQLGMDDDCPLPNGPFANCPWKEKKK
ncbi:hypothetical protein GCM10027589_27210 [Actinocorallia lasiicapitis]